MIEKFRLDNLYFMLYEISFYKKVNAEHYVYDLFNKLGYNISRSERRFDRDVGLPDFYLEGGILDGFFVEVKTNGDGLRDQQIKWIKNNPDKKVICFHLIQKTQLSELRKIKKQQERKEKDFNEINESAKLIEEIL